MKTKLGVVEFKDANVKARQRTIFNREVEFSVLLEYLNVL
jgi:hypothetical protein